MSFLLLGTESLLFNAYLHVAASGGHGGYDGDEADHHHHLDQYTTKNDVRSNGKKANKGWKGSTKMLPLPNLFNLITAHRGSALLRGDRGAW